MLFFLLNRIAWETPSVRSIAEYFNLSEPPWVEGGEMKFWKPSIFSKEIREKVKTFSPDRYTKGWNEWNNVF
jgi:hypothetical protein